MKRKRLAVKLVKEKSASPGPPQKTDHHRTLSFLNIFLNFSLSFPYPASISYIGTSRRRSSPGQEKLNSRHALPHLRHPSFGEIHLLSVARREKGIPAPRRGKTRSA